MQKELETASELAVNAGRLLLKHYEPKPQVEWKGKGNPVMKADRLGSRFLIRRGEFAVMLGLALDGAPILWVVYHPVAEKLYCAAHGSGAILKEHGGVTSLRVSRQTDPQRMTIALSRSHHSPTIDAICRRLHITRSIRSGSIGLKVGMICEGHAHLYLDMSGRTSLWDTCAPAALLHEAGGRMTDLKGMQLRYDSPELRHLNGIIATNGTIHDRVVEAVSYV